MTHRKWTPGALMAKAYRDITEEHNATVDAWQQAAADVDRLAAINGDLCDELAGLRAKTKPPVTREVIARAIEDLWCLPGTPTPEDEADAVLAVLADCAEDDDTNIAICPQCFRAHDTRLGSVPFGTDETPEQIEIKRLKQEAHYDGVSAAERIAELERELADWKAGRYIAVVQGEEHAGVSHGVMVPPIHVPFSDAQVEKMAKAGFAAWHGGDGAKLTEQSAPVRARWAGIIRAALAAGGLEPCAVPQYAPEDVAVSGRDVAWLRAKIENQRMTLRQLHEARARDAVDSMKLESEFVSVTAERDKARAELAAVKAERDNAVDERNQHIKREYTSWETEFRKVEAERDELKKSSELLSVVYKGEMDARKSAQSELAALRQRDAVPVDPTPEQVEALARVLHKAQDGFYCRYGDHATKFDDYAPLWLACARAAYAHIGRVPVGVELDVHPDQLELYKWVTMPDGGYTYAAQQAIDICRSRIRPVYECKECAAAKRAVQIERDGVNALTARIDAARAALESE